MSERPRIYFGLCDGGPYKARHLAHPETIHTVCVDRYSKKAIPGLQAPSAAFPNIKVGRYTWDDEFGLWHWHWLESQPA